MNQGDIDTQWFAVRARHTARAMAVLEPLCAEVFFPREKIVVPGKKPRMKALIPHVLFIRSSRQEALEIERLSHRENSIVTEPIWIYRYPNDTAVQEISPASINLLRMLAESDAGRCEIFNKQNFKPKERVRITGGIYEGYTGHVQRVKKNLHVIVRIEGVCLVMLPFIHPDLLEKIQD